MFHAQGDVANSREISLRRILPAILEFLGYSAAAFRESCIADFFAVHQNLSLGLADSFSYMGRCFLGDTLVALAVVVGTYIKEGVVFAVVPADERIFLLGEGEEVVAALSHLSALFICARSHEREMTACAFRSSRLEVALISLLMTLSRYFSTGNSLIATILSDSTTKRSVPRKVWVSLRSQWKLTPMVTSLSETRRRHSADGR